jgi:hypothetical protein
MEKTRGAVACGTRLVGSYPSPANRTLVEIYRFRAALSLSPPDRELALNAGVIERLRLGQAAAREQCHDQRVAIGLDMKNCAAVVTARALRIASGERRRGRMRRASIARRLWPKLPSASLRPQALALVARVLDFTFGVRHPREQGARPRA